METFAERWNTSGAGMSINSAGPRGPLFADFITTMAESDCFDPYVFDLDILLSSAAPLRPPRIVEAVPSLSSGAYVRCRIPQTTRSPAVPHQIAVLRVSPSTDEKTSAFRTITLLMLDHPGHTYRYRCVNRTLTDAAAGIAVEAAVLPFLLHGPSLTPPAPVSSARFT